MPGPARVCKFKSRIKIQKKTKKHWIRVKPGWICYAVASVAGKPSHRAISCQTLSHCFIPPPFLGNSIYDFTGSPALPMGA